MNSSKKNKLEEYHRQKVLIDSFPEPENDFERVDYNYKCNNFNSKVKLKKMFLNLVSTMAIPPFLLLYGCNRIICRNKNKDKTQDGTIIIESSNRKGKMYDLEEMIPDFGEKYEPVYEFKPGVFPKMTEGVLGWNSFKIFSKFFWRHPLEGFYNLRCLVNVMGYNKILHIYSPKAIVNSRMELNPMSSLITHLCEENECEFICFMHGEVMINIRTAFVRFSQFYVWDEHYVDVFNWARCDSNQFVVYFPKLYKLNDCTRVEKPEYYITYYLTGDEISGEDKNASQILDILNTIAKKDQRCKVRPHPRWSNIEKLKKIFAGSEIDIEDPGKVSLDYSILNSEIIVGTFSTVLTQAYYYGKKVYIDDVSDKELIDELDARKYFLINKNVGKISELMY